MNTQAGKFAALVFTALALAAGPAFGAEGDFQTAANNDGSVTITKYTGWDTEITIPAAIGGKKVTAIGESAFEKADLTAVTIPNGVVTIGSNAFRGNKLTAVTIPGSVVTIKHGAFMSNQLTGVVIPEGVREIGHSAFAKNKLTAISLPSTLEGESLRIYTFDEEWVKLPGTVTLAANINADLDGVVPESARYNYIAGGRKAGVYTADMPCAAKNADDYEYMETPNGAVITRYSGSGSRVRVPAELGGVPVKAIDRQVFYEKYIENLLIPEGITYIGEGAFYRNNLTVLTLPASVTYIGGEAFRGNQLTALTIPAGVTRIEAGAFAGNNLASVTLPAGVTHIGAEAFASNQLTSCTVPANVTYIGAGAFSGNRLTSLTIGGKVSYIGARAFYDHRLSAVNIPASVRYIGDEAFAQFADTYDGTYKGATLTSVTIAPGVTYIGDYAFGNSRTILVGPKMSVIFPATLTRLGGWPLPGYNGSSFVLQSTVVRARNYDAGEQGDVTLKAGRYTYGNRGWEYSAN